MSPAIAVPPACANSFTYRVSYAETDQMGRVYYGNYLTWFERGRTELLRAAGYPYRALEERHIWLPVRQCQSRYLGYAVYDDEVRLCTWIAERSRARVTFVTHVYRLPEEGLITIGTVELACVSPAGRPQQFPDDIAAALDRFLATE